MQIHEFLIGIIAYFGVFLTYYSSLFFGSFAPFMKSEALASADKRKKLLLYVLLSALLFNYALSKLVAYTNFSAFLISIVIWISGSVIAISLLHILRRISLLETAVYSGGFLVAMLAVASVYSIF